MRIQVKTGKELREPAVLEHFGPRIAQYEIAPGWPSSLAPYRTRQKGSGNPWINSKMERLRVHFVW